MRPDQQNGNIQKPSFLETWSGKSARWIGSTQSFFLHTLIFAGFFWSGYKNGDWDKVLLILTTIVSLEAIYLSIFIQMTINRNTVSLEDVEEGLDIIQEDVGELQEDIGEIHDDVEEINFDDNPEADVHEKTQVTLSKIEQNLQKLMEDVQTLQKQKDI